MRGWVLLMLFLTPLASGLQTPTEWNGLPTNQPDEQEVLLVLDQAVWTSEHWALLVQHNVQPLRSIEPNALLVWSRLDTSWPLEVRAEAYTDATYLSPLDEAVSEPSLAKVVFEPRLPDLAVESLLLNLQMLGGEVMQLHAGVGSLPASATMWFSNPAAVSEALSLPGILWVEPVLTTKARNGQASSLMQLGEVGASPFWALGLNGTGVVLGVADSGIDADHACFRNATSDDAPYAEISAPYPAVGLFGAEHRKIVHLNTSIDDNDTPGDSDYRHGTHVIGSLACHDVYAYRNGAEPSNGTSMAHGATLVVQDIVSSNGWEPPQADALLNEASVYGAVIHSNSWGDDTTAYTERTGRFDAYARAMPWSLAFIAPGNSGEGVLEPANGRNVVAVSASTKSTVTERWSTTAYGPTEANTDGIFLLAPGASISSAAADGFWSSNNNNLRLSSGTSMATPLAAGSAGIIQQLYEDGWIVAAHEPMTDTVLAVPPWSQDGDVSILLGEGFTPSGSLLRASLALAVSPLNESNKNGGMGGHNLHNTYDGWGVLNLSRLVDIEQIAPSSSPTSSLWIHDSYRLMESSVAEWLEVHQTGPNNLSGFEQNQWNGSGAIGPFLQTGDVFRQRLTPLVGEDVRVRLAHPAQPSPSLVDDLQLRVVLEDGTVLLPDRLQASGEPTRHYGNAVDFNNSSLFPHSNETVFGIDVPASYLEGMAWFDVEVMARYVQPGGAPNTVGLDGDAVGFGLVVQGVDRDSSDHLDGDGDGVPNLNDACPYEDATLADEDGDGCLDDDDNDGIVNPLDACPLVDATGYDLDANGCLDDSDGDGVTDDVDECATDDLSWPVMATGCYPLDNAPTLLLEQAPLPNATLDGVIVVEWRVNDIDGDATDVVFEWVMVNQTNLTLASCAERVVSGALYRCEWSFPEAFPPYYLEGERYDLMVSFVTTNASPAADLDEKVLRVSQGLVIPMNDEGGMSPNTPSSEQPLVLFWSVVGLLAGMAFARWYRSSKKQAISSDSPAPFLTGLGEEDG